MYIYIYICICNVYVCIYIYSIETTRGLFPPLNGYGGFFHAGLRSGRSIWTAAHFQWQVQYQSRPWQKSGWNPASLSWICARQIPLVLAPREFGHRSRNLSGRVGPLLLWRSTDFGRFPKSLVRSSVFELSGRSYFEDLARVSRFGLRSPRKWRSSPRS